ncbi:MAG: hypothetical protein DMG10_02810 [Acidobacteria bacterium]|nr:MAG: hypothetical protein DMG10_02810 [Acidobacteriota bacterium]
MVLAAGGQWPVVSGRQRKPFQTDHWPLPPAAKTMHSPHLERRFGLLHATALNMSNMVGIGPFHCYTGLS